MLSGGRTQVVICVRLLKETAFADEFERNAESLDTEDGYLNEAAIPSNLKTRVVYPSVDHLIVRSQPNK